MSKDNPGEHDPHAPKAPDIRPQTEEPGIKKPEVPSVSPDIPKGPEIPSSPGPNKPEIPIEKPKEPEVPQPAPSYPHEYSDTILLEIFDAISINDIKIFHKIIRKHQTRLCEFFMM